MASQGRSWRPEKKRNKRDTRRRTIVVLICILVGLVSAVLVPMFLMPMEPPVRLLVIRGGNYEVDPAGIPGVPNSAAPKNEERLFQLFEKLHAFNEQRMSIPLQVESLDDLDRSAHENEKLVIYCSMDTICAWDDKDESVSIMLRPYGRGSPVGLDAFLNQIAALKPNQAVVLLDPVGASPGLASGMLADEMQAQIQQVVEASGFKDLVVICSRSNNQRSWEYVASDTEDTDEGSASQTFAGTAFSHFIEQAFRTGDDGNVATTEALHAYVKTNVTDWAASSFGAQQDVLLMEGSAGAAGAELLSRIHWPSAEDLEEQAVDDPDSETEGDGDEVPPEDDGDPDIATPGTRLAELTRRFTELDDSGRAIARRAWITTEASLVAAETAVLHQDDETFGRMFDLATASIDTISEKLKATLDDNVTTEFSPWLMANTNDEVPPAELEAVFEEARDILLSEDRSLRLPSSLRGTGTGRTAFVSQFLLDLDNLSTVIASSTPEDQIKMVQDRVELIQQLGDPKRGWPKSRWPQELLTIDEVLSAQEGVSSVEVLSPLLQLIRLRGMVLQLATGALDDGRPVRVSVWDAAADDLGVLLQDLTAAERWLAMGSAGIKMAKRVLQDSQGRWNQVAQRVKLNQQLTAVVDTQQTSLAAIIQFLAMQQEQVALADNELDTTALSAALKEGQPELHYPPALSNEKIGMTARHIRAMFALTRKFESAGVSQIDSAHLKLLHEYLEERIADAVVVSERHRLSGVPEFTTQRVALQESLFSGGVQAAVDGKRRTGVWLSFWSIRLLESLSNQNQDDAWKLWQTLAENVRGEDQEAAFRTHTQLADYLRQQYSQLRKSQADESFATLFVMPEKGRSLLVADVAARYAATVSNRSVYAQIHRNLDDSVPAISTSAISLTDETVLDEDDEITIDLDSSGGTKLFVSRCGLQLTDRRTELIADWYRLDNVKTGEKLTFRATETLTEPVTMTLALADQNNLVLKSHSVTIHPNNKTKWDVQVFRSDTNELNLREDELKLPPTTWSAKDKKHVAVPLTVRLVQDNGHSKRIRVQCYNSATPGEGTAFWPEPMELEIDESNSVIVPLSPTGAKEPKPTDPPPPVYDVRNGISFEITPVDLFDAKPFRTPLQPILARRLEFIERPAPVFDTDDNRLTIQLKRVPDLSGLLPAAIPAEIHFSTALQRVLINAQAGGASVPNISEAEQFEFQFNDEIVSAFHDDQPGVNDENDLEFGLTIAGIPHAWRWRLTESGVELLNDDLPTVRTELTANIDKAAKPVRSEPVLLYAADWEDASLNAAMHVHGGNIQGQKVRWNLHLKVQNKLTQQPRPVLEDPIPLTSRFDESVTVTAGKKGTWDFSTNIALYARMQIQPKSLGLGSGQYDLIAQLIPVDGTQKTIEHRTTFIFDSTGPVIAGGPATPHPANKPLAGSVTVTDAESAVTLVQFGMQPDAPMPANREGNNWKFQISPEKFPPVNPALSTPSSIGTLYIVSTNAAGLPTKKKMEITFQAKPTAKPGVQTGTVVFQGPDAAYTASLKGTDTSGKPHSDSAAGKGPVKFESVPTGKYKIVYTLKINDISKTTPEFEVKPGMNSVSK